MDFIILYFDLINNYLENNFITTLLIYFILLTIYLSFSLPGNLFFFVFSGYLFNFYIGFFINLISITIGSFNFFIFSKLFIKKFFNNFYNKYSIKVSSIIKNSSYEYLVLLRLIPGPPLMAQNLCLSILNISKSKFFLTTFIGFIPMMMLAAYVGSSLSNFIELKNYDTKNIFSYNFLFILFLLILLIFIRIVIKKK